MEHRPERRGHHAVAFHGALAFALAISSALVLGTSLGAPWDAWLWLGAWLVGINATSLGYYGFDKSQARRGGDRVPEVVLHGLAVAGGSLGAFAGMRWFRHKTLKGRFRLVFWLIVIGQVGLIAALGFRLWTGRAATAGF